MKALVSNYDGIKYQYATTGFAFRHVAWNTSNILRLRKDERILVQQIYLKSRKV